MQNRSPKPALSKTFISYRAIIGTDSSFSAELPLAPGRIDASGYNVRLPTLLISRRINSDHRIGSPSGKSRLGSP